MKRISVSMGISASVILVAGLCLAGDPRHPGNPPVAPTSPQPAPTVGPGGGSRYVAPPNQGGTVVNTNQRAAEARRAAQAAAAQQAAAQAASNAAAARAAAASAAARAKQNSNTQPRYSPNPSYGNNGYSPYGYSPYGYSPYGYPPGTSPYALVYDPSTGSTFLVPYGGGYSPYYSQYGNRYPYYRNPYLGYGYPSAVFVNPSLLYGLGPIQQLMGVGGWFQQPQGNPNGNPNQFNGNGNQGGIGNGNGNGNANPGLANPGLANNAKARADVAAQDADPPAGKAAAPAAGGKAMELAWKFITFGDAHFGNQKYNDALDRYRRAARECPTLGDAWFREGFALAALGKYDQAAKAMRHGIEEKPDWVDGNFRLSQLYGNDADEKTTLLDKMIKEAEDQPNNADVAYVLGVHLYCDGKTDQSAPFFHRAAQVLGSDADVKSFLAKRP